MPLNLYWAVVNGLARDFLDHLQAEAQVALASVDPNELSLALSAFVARARAAHPTVHVDDRAFARYVAERFEPGQQLDGTHAEGLYLACGCALGNEHALRELERTASMVMNACYRRLGFQQWGEEISQRVMRAILVHDGETGPSLMRYNGRGSLANWVRVVTVREAYRLTRAERKKSQREVGGVEERIMDQAVIDEANPELLHLKRDYRAKFKLSFQQAFLRLEHRERNILRYQYLDGLNLEQIGTIYDASRATVARWRASARAQLLAETRRIMRDEFNVPLDEFDGAIRLIESAMDVSLSRLLTAVARDSTD